MPYLPVLGSCPFLLCSPRDLSSCHTHLAFYIVFLLPFRVYQDVSLLVRFQGPLERVELSGTKKNHKCKYYTFKVSLTLLYYHFICAIVQN